MAKIRAEYAEVRERHRNRGPGKQLVLAGKGTRAAILAATGRITNRRSRSQPGITVFDDYDLAELRPYIDWTPFFQAWELAGHYPAILTDDIVGAQASELFRDAQAMLDRIIAEKWLTARGVIGLWPAASVGDDIEVYTGADGAEARDAASPAPAGRQAGRAPRFLRWPTSSHPRTRQVRTGSAASPSPPASASKSTWSASKPHTTTIRRSCSRHWPTASPKPSPSACTNAYAANSGAMCPMKHSTTKR